MSVSFKECEERGHPLSLTGSGYHWCACAKRKEPTSETRFLLEKVAGAIRREADKYESNSTGMTDERGEVYDGGWLAGMRRAADFVEAGA